MYGVVGAPSFRVLAQPFRFRGMIGVGSYVRVEARVPHASPRHSDRRIHWRFIRSISFSFPLSLSHGPMGSLVNHGPNEACEACGRCFGRA